MCLKTVLWHYDFAEVCVFMSFIGSVVISKVSGGFYLYISIYFMCRSNIWNVRSQVQIWCRMFSQKCLFESCKLVNVWPIVVNKSLEENVCSVWGNTERNSLHNIIMCCNVSRMVVFLNLYTNLKIRYIVHEKWIYSGMGYL